jgi:hypothetical protein
LESGASPLAQLLQVAKQTLETGPIFEERYFPDHNRRYVPTEQQHLSSWRQIDDASSDNYPNSARLRHDLAAAERLNEHRYSPVALRAHRHQLETGKRRPLRIEYRHVGQRQPTHRRWP